MKILLGCDMKIVLVWGEWTFCESNLLGRTFPGGGGMGEFLASVGGTPPIPPVEKILLLSTPQKKMRKILNLPEVGENVRSPKA